MVWIQVTALIFCYDGSFDNIFENVTFGIDTNWKLGFIGRNGKRKTTFAHLLLGKYKYRGNITAQNLHFDYFPYQTEEADFNKTASELMEILYHPFRTLSQGEQMKVMLAVLFQGNMNF